MTSVRLLQTCCISTSLNALFSRDSPLSIHKAAIAVAVAAAQRTTTRIAASPQSRPLPHHTPFRRRTTYHPNFWNKTSLPPPPSPPRSFTLRLALRRIEATRLDRLRSQHMEATVPLQNSIDDAMLLPGTPSPVSRPPRKGHERHASVATRYADDSVPPSPTPSRPPNESFPETARPSRSGSTASRSTNRLSLTLPIAPPSAYPSRPTPASTTTASFPPTPLDTPSSLLSPTDDPNDFITAIAAQERRVLELGEDLRTAKHELDRLKRQFMHYEASRERQRERLSRRNVEPLRPVTAAAALDPDATTRNAELDRRKALLLHQTTQQLASPTAPTAENSRRRIFSGAHTRTLSLLSPTKPSSPIPEGSDPSAPHPPFDPRPSPRPGHVAKRASWAPRSTPLPPPAGGVKQIAADLRHGIWTFVEDLRQATVGDEPISGDRRRHPSSDHDTIRALPSSKPHVSSLFSDEPEASGGRRTLTRSSTDVSTAKTKRFSWTPLTVDAYDDNDWSNWDSPGGGAGGASASAAQRWSGTTVNGDIIPSGPPGGGGAETPLKSKFPQHQRSPLGSSGGGDGGEMFPVPVFGQISDGIQKVMRGWERSLAPAEGRAASPGRLV
ncbi:hypothetical protein QBC39DRAFT_388735 [Podospora conica]|nr:hypothetical protein QBC39DRAFT_388735 [Schizothecium conicum]